MTSAVTPSRTIASAVPSQANGLISHNALFNWVLPADPEVGRAQTDGHLLPNDRNGLPFLPRPCARIKLRLNCRAVSAEDKHENMPRQSPIKGEPIPDNELDRLICQSCDKKTVVRLNSGPEHYIQARMQSLRQDGLVIEPLVDEIDNEILLAQRQYIDFPVGGALIVVRPAGLGRVGRINKRMVLYKPLEGMRVQRRRWFRTIPAKKLPARLHTFNGRKIEGAEVVDVSELGICISLPRTMHLKRGSEILNLQVDYGRFGKFNLVGVARSIRYPAYAKNKMLVGIELMDVTAEKRETLRKYVLACQRELIRERSGLY